MASNRPIMHTVDCLQVYVSKKNVTKSRKLPIPCTHDRLHAYQTLILCYLDSKKLICILEGVCLPVKCSVGSKVATPLSVAFWRWGYLTSRVRNQIQQAERNLHAERGSLHDRKAYLLWWKLSVLPKYNPD